MDRKIFEGQWDQVEGNLKKYFSRLTDDQFTEIKGNNQAIYGALEEKYGYTKDQAKEAISKFLESTADTVKEWLPNLSKSVSRQVDQFKDCTARSSEIVKEKVQENPLAAVGIAAAVGFLLGCWFKK